MAYIDTSVLVAYYCPEPLSKAAQRFVSNLDEPTISPLVELELYSAVATKVRTGELEQAAANRIVSLFDSHVTDQLYRKLAIEAREFLLAREWIGRFTTPLRTLDALHLARAFTSGLPLLTADRALAGSASVLGVEHKLIA